MVANIIQSGPISISDDDFMLSVSVLCGSENPYSMSPESPDYCLSTNRMAFIADDVTIRKRFCNCKVHKYWSSWGLRKRIVASWYSIRSWYSGLSDRSLMVDPLSYFSFQPVLHDWCKTKAILCAILSVGWCI